MQIANMTATSQSAKVLAAALTAHGWTQSDLAKLSSIAIPTVSHHLTGQRVIRDDHLALYIKVLDKTEQTMLVSAWLRDCLPESIILNVLEPQKMSIRDEVREWAPGLSAEQKDMLTWWAKKLAADDELASIFEAITAKAGWKYSPSC